MLKMFCRLGFRVWMVVMAATAQSCTLNTVTRVSSVSRTFYCDENTDQVPSLPGLTPSVTVSGQRAGVQPLPVRPHPPCL